MLPIRLSLVTYNLWNTQRWPERQPALGQFVTLFRPDILCLQELRAETQSFLDATLPGHQRVHDPLPGWTSEGNIYWDGTFLEEVEHGAEEVAILEAERRLFWVRLKLKDQARTIFVGTAHLTYQGHPIERDTGQSPRVEQTRRTVAALQRLAYAGEPVFFAGDLNDAVHPGRILREAGYVSCFAALGIPNPPTIPCYPTRQVEPGTFTSSATIDWVVANDHARAVAAQVPHCYHGDMAPSDHWPVLAVYQI